MCPQCNNHYANRAACNKCGAPPVAAGGYGKASGKGGAMVIGPYQPQAAGVRPLPGAAPASAAGVSGMRQGDWMCPSCSNHNYADKVACNRCRLAKPGAGMATPMMYAMVVPATQEKRPGDWKCYGCNNNNYASRASCNKCGIAKAAYISKTGMRSGDWLCPTCQNHNYANKVICNKCCTPKGETKVHVPVLKEGDWICSTCSNHNYANKPRCNKCGGEKHSYSMGGRLQSSSFWNLVT